MSSVTPETRGVVEAEGLPIVLPPHLLASFEKADRQIHETYGATPGVPLLVRLWPACGKTSHIRREFELAAIGKTTRGDEFDDDEIDGDEIRFWAADVQTRSTATGDWPPRQQWLGKMEGTMPSLKQIAAEKKAQQEPTLRRNPEINASWIDSSRRTRPCLSIVGGQVKTRQGALRTAPQSRGSAPRP